MNRKVVTVLSVFIILLFIGYIVFDTARPSVQTKNETSAQKAPEVPDAWKISKEIKPGGDSLKAVTVTISGKVYVGGNSFVSCYDKDLNLLWNVKTPAAVTALSNYGDSVFAATTNQILVMDPGGKILNEWGPFEDRCLITSVNANKKFVAFADAGNKSVFILDKGGEVKKIIGQNDKQFIIPSPFFDVALDYNNNLFVANTGHHRIETRSIDGVVKSFFGEPGLAPEYFCGCCAPAHFALVPQGFVTAEKGINRIKILNMKGEFVEYVNSKNSFIKSVPLDLASADGITIYAVYPGDSKLYVFNRKTL
jgi:hypothetical protein